MISILITDDHPVVRRGIRQILEDEETIGFIDEAGSGKELTEKISKNHYDLILLDITLPDRNGLDLIRQIKKVRPEALILLLTIHTEELYAETAFISGASGYLSKSSPPEELVIAIKNVYSGERYISPSLAEKYNGNILKSIESTNQRVLSVREMEVLTLFGAGKTIGQIAEKLSLSPKTINTYRDRLLVKLKLKTTAELIRYAVLEKDRRKKS
jgi:DNA-binding NarL/FixJ family response regulator